MSAKGKKLSTELQQYLSSLDLEEVVQDICGFVDNLVDDGYHPVVITQALVYVSALMLVREEIDEEWATEQLKKYASCIKASISAEAANGWGTKVRGEA